jgi:hypothetical protein
VNRKRKGTNREHRSIALLEAAGYRCTRAAASLGVWDVVAIGSQDGSVRNHPNLSLRGRAYRRLHRGGEDAVVSTL